MNERERLLTLREVNEARTHAVRNWEDFKPGVYRYVYAGAERRWNRDDSSHYTDIAVLGFAPDSRYRYVPLSTNFYGTPREWTGCLSDAGVHRTSERDGSLPGYLGENFVVPIEHFPSR
jgi:hypothetical protein